MEMSAEIVERLFTQSDGSYSCARWGRPVVPVIFGVADAVLPALKGAIEAVVALAGHRMAETDPELGANLMLFFCADWAELAQVPDLDRLVEGLGALLGRLEAEGANQYRVFRYDADGAIRAGVVFIRLAGGLEEMAAADLGLVQAAGAMLSWGPEAFQVVPPLARIEGGTVLHPVVAGVIRAAYAPSMPSVARDGSHALRLSARLDRPE